jgi:uncharacterized lipoprotein YmbA
MIRIFVWIPTTVLVIAALILGGCGTKENNLVGFEASYS